METTEFVTENIQEAVDTAVELMPVENVAEKAGKAIAHFEINSGGALVIGFVLATGAYAALDYVAKPLVKKGAERFKVWKAERKAKKNLDSGNKKK